MQNNIKILILAAVLIVGGIVHTASAVTLSSIETVISDRSLVTTATGFAPYNGNICPSFCPNSTEYYTETITLDGVSQGTRNIGCLGTSDNVLECAHIVEKTTTPTCTYTTDVITWGECNSSGIQYPTEYKYATVDGADCTDLAPISRACGDTEGVYTAICPFSGTAESPVVNLNGGLARGDPAARTLFGSTKMEQFVSVTIPAGEYIVETASFDGYVGRENDGVQPNERFLVDFISGGTTVGTKGPTTDIADGVNYDTKVDGFGAVTLGRAIDTVRFYHNGPATDYGQSLMPVCVKLTKQDTNPGPTLTFEANPGSIVKGGKSTLTWTATNADTCIATGDWSGTKSNTGGTEEVFPTEDSQYFLECTNTAGSTGKRSVDVFVTEPVLSSIIPKCPYTSTTESPVIDINSGLGRDDPSIRVIYYHNPEVEQAVSIPAGTYTVQTVSWDGYATRIDTGIQPTEYWTVDYISGGTVLGKHGPTTDIKDLVIEDTQLNSFGPITFSSTVDTLLLKHGNIWNAGNSVVPVCIKFIKQDEVPAVPTAPACPFTSETDSPVIDVNGGIKRAEARVLRESDPEFDESVSIPAGTYRVYTASWDGFITRATADVQLYEQWNIDYISGGAVIGSDGPTTDLVDSVPQNTQLNQFGPTTFLSDIDTLRFKHVPENTFESVVPVCVKFVAEAAVPETTEPVTACSLSGGTLITVNPDGMTKDEVVAASGLLSGTAGNQSFEKVLGTPIPSGTYTIDTQSWEGKLDRATDGVQLNEMFMVGFYDAANTLLAEVGPTTELLDNRVEDTQLNKFEHIDFTSDVTKLRFAKKDLGGTIGYTGSVIPVCVRFTDEGAPTTLTVGLTQSPSDYEISLGTPIQWTATANNGTGPYTFVWSGGTVSGNGTPLASDPNNSNYVAPTITTPGEKTITVTVTDSSTPVQTASATKVVKIKHDVKPQ